MDRDTGYKTNEPYHTFQKNNTIDRGVGATRVWGSRLASYPNPRATTDPASRSHRGYPSSTSPTDKTAQPPS